MSKRPHLWLALLAIPALALGGVAYAEGGGESAPKPVVRRKAPKPAPKPTLPAAPIPYTTYSHPLPPEVAKALTPAVEAPHAVITPDILPQPAETTAPVTVAPKPLEPLPPPVVVAPAPLTVQPMDAPPPVYAAPPPPVSGSGQISLKCDTQTTEGKRLISRGTFYIELFPSPVFPDTHADFKFLFVDPAHDSLIRDSICLDTMCTANVTGAAYYLVNRVTKKGAALRITLDRTKGAFYAEEIGTDGLKGNDSHKGEQGYCVPQGQPVTLF